MGLYERHVLPRVVDVVCGTGQIHKRRAVVCSGLRGEVVEIGFGSGHNVQHYPGEVTAVAAVEPNDDAWALAHRQVAQSAVPVRRTDLDGQHLSEPDGTFDAALSTFTLCTIPDHGLALRELFRVLRPGGELHFLEHGVSPEDRVRRWQRRLEPVQKRLGGGCHLTRDPVAAIEAAGFEVIEVETGYLPGPAALKPAGYLYRGRAVKAAG